MTSLDAIQSPEDVRGLDEHDRRELLRKAATLAAWLVGNGSWENGGGQSRSDDALVEWVTPQFVARTLDVSERTAINLAHKWLATGMAKRVGKLWRINKAEFERYRNSRHRKTL